MLRVVDIAGLVAGASSGAGMGNQFLSDVRETDAILHVVRCFATQQVNRADGSLVAIQVRTVLLLLVLPLLLLLLLLLVC